MFGGGNWTVRPSTWANGFALWHLKTTTALTCMFVGAMVPWRETTEDDLASLPRARTVPSNSGPAARPGLLI